MSGFTRELKLNTLMSLLTPETLQTMCDIADAAGREIMGVYDNGGLKWEKEDKSPLTEADLRADRVIRERLLQYFPGIFVWSEESISEGSRDVKQFFLVDPLDGTKEFLKRNAEFTVNIALIENGQAVAGVVFAPALNEMFYAMKGTGSYKRDKTGLQRIASGMTKNSKALKVIGSRSHGTELLKDWLAELGGPYQFVEAGSSLKFCRIAEGSADIYPRFGPTSQWDTAAAQAVLEVSGGVVTDLHRKPLRYGLTMPVLNPFFVAVAHRELLELI